jgi:hypothetical protein
MYVGNTGEGQRFKVYKELRFELVTQTTVGMSVKFLYVKVKILRNYVSFI